jgi:hypothetical protein
MMNGTHDDPTIVLVGDVRISPEDARDVEVWNGRLWAFDCAFSNPLHAIRNIELHDQEIAFERKKYETLSRALQYLTKNVPNWRTARHENGTPLYSLDGTLLNDEGDRSIFDDVDE